jgi:two-component system, NarL family, sensor kinase
MKSFSCFLMMVLITYSLYAQIIVDSTPRSFQKVTISKDTLQRYLDQIAGMDPTQTDKIQRICEWVIKESDDDSLREMQARAQLVLGKFYAGTLSFEEATQYLTKALALAEKHNFTGIQAEVFNELGGIYQRNQQNEKAIEYFHKSFSISNSAANSRGVALALFSLGSIQLQTGYRNEDSVRSAVNLMLRGFKTISSLKDTPNIITQISGLVGGYIALKQYDSARMILDTAEAMIKITGNKAAYVRLYNRVGSIFNARKKYPEAIKYYNKGLLLAKQYKIPRWQCMYYTGLAETYQNIGDFKKANWYNRLNIRMHDALVFKENFVAAADIQNRYERAKKDNEILKLAAINRKKSVLNFVLISSTLALSLISFLGYINYKNRAKISKQDRALQNQKIAELEKDKQLVVINAMLKGQEEERSRIAKDLHDGVGGALSGIKLSLMNIKGKISLSREYTALFDRSLSMVDNTIGDLRKVAHNLMPETLIRFGLNDSLRDFCDAIRFSSSLEIIYQWFGETRKLSNSAEVFTYRIVQELVNNAIRHANARQIVVQITMMEDKIGIAVEDDGRGFNKDDKEQMKGAGMTNIAYRVQYFNGTLDIVTTLGNGTSVNIELKA